MLEGAAEFTAEMISGEVAYSAFYASTQGHQKEIETAFVADENKTDLSSWLDHGTPEKPGDLGYWEWRTARKFPREQLRVNAADFGVGRDSLTSSLTSDA